MKLRDPELLRTRAFIGGEWLNANDGATHPVTNPATREVLGTVPVMGAAETRRAIEAAQAAFPAWAARTAKERAAILRRWYELLMANQDDLATLMTAEQGKPFAEAKGEIAYARLLHRVVRRGGQAPLRRRDPRPSARQAHPRAAPAGGRGGRDHAVEFPARDDHAQGRTCARRRLHLRLQARRPDALLGTRGGGCSPSAPGCRPGCSTSSPAMRARSAGR